MIHHCLIVPASKQVIAKSICSGLAGESAQEMFTVGLSNTGNAPATHYVSVGPVDESFIAAMSAPETLHSVCNYYGLPVSFSDCADLISQSDISEELAEVSLSRLSLRKIT